MTRPLLKADTVEALDALAIKNESYDTIIWKLLADAGHVEQDQDLDLEEDPEEDPGLLDQIWAWFTEGREEVLEEE